MKPHTDPTPYREPLVDRIAFWVTPAMACGLAGTAALVSVLHWLSEL